MRSKKVLSVLGAAALGLVAQSAAAAPTLRVQVDQRGDFVLLGNTLGHDCRTGVPAPVVGDVGACGNNTSDSAIDVFWRSDEPGAGQAAANTSIAPADARSTAMLVLPAGATITHAYLYWAGTLNANTPDLTAKIAREGVFDEDVLAITAATGTYQGRFHYQSVANITDLVKARGAGAYRVSGVDTLDMRNLANETVFAGWWMAVFYELASDPPRNLALFDGLDVVDNGTVTSNISGFRVPNAGFDGKLGVVAYEGDDYFDGDSLSFNGGAPLSNGLNPASNFFNGTRSTLGVAVSNVGDLPQLTGAAASMSGMDIDVVDIKDHLTAGDTAATLTAKSANDTFMLGGFVTSISTFRPDFSTSAKSVKVVGAGSVLPGSTLEYTIVAKNTGNDAAVGTVLVDALPAGITYVPGSIAIAAGPNSGGKTDAAGDDQAEYDAGTRTLTVRLGAGANATQGGSIGIDESTTVTFRVTVDGDASGAIANQANITAAGDQGAPAKTTPTDGNGPDPGNPPTTVEIVECGSDADCSADKPICDLASNKCTSTCADDVECGGPTSGRVCHDTTRVCADGCRGEGGNGCAATEICSSTTSEIGTCGPAGPGDGDAGNGGNGGGKGPDGGAGSSGGAGGDLMDDEAFASGNGFLCNAHPGGATGSGLALLAVGAAAAIGAVRRRRPRA